MKQLQELKALIEKLKELPIEIENKRDFDKYFNQGKELGEKVKEINDYMRKNGRNFKNSLEWQNFRKENLLSDEEFKKLFLMQRILQLVKFSNRHNEISILLENIEHNSNNEERVYEEFIEHYQLQSQSTAKEKLEKIKDTFEKVNKAINEIAEKSSKKVRVELEQVKQGFNKIISKTDELLKLPIMPVLAIERFQGHAISTALLKAGELKVKSTTKPVANMILTFLDNLKKRIFGLNKEEAKLALSKKFNDQTLSPLMASTNRSTIFHNPNVNKIVKIEKDMRSMEVGARQESGISLNAVLTEQQQKDIEEKIGEQVGSQAKEVYMRLKAEREKLMSNNHSSSAPKLIHQQ